MIWLLAGTAEGREIFEACLRRGWRTVATVVTEYGRFLLERTALNGFWDFKSAECLKGEGLKGEREKEKMFEKMFSLAAGPLGTEEMYFLIKDQGIKVAVDATHPFAVEVSQNAREACKKAGIPYIRYCRRSCISQRVSSGSVASEAGEIVVCGDFKAAAQKAAELGEQGTVFLTVGSRLVPVFAAAAREKGRRVVARVLPEAQAIEKCREAGLEPADIIAMQGPFSAELNKALFKAYKATVVVTKDSGAEGGTREKIQAAAELGIPVVVVSRPQEFADFTDEENMITVDSYELLFSHLADFFLGTPKKLRCRR